jgi:hypothetical protein
MSNTHLTPTDIDRVKSHADWLQGDHDRCNPWLANTINALVANHSTNSPSTGLERIGDGRPMETDVFLVKLRGACDDHYDRDDAIKHWLEGSWDEALEYLDTAE